MPGQCKTQGLGWGGTAAGACVKGTAAESGREPAGVAAAARGQRVGAELLHVVFAWADAERCEVYLECGDDPLPFYQKLGFRIVWRHEIRADAVGADAVSAGGRAGRAGSTAQAGREILLENLALQITY